MTDYKQLLEHSYAQECASASSPPASRLEYLADHILNFTTYEQEMSEMFAGRAVLVCDAISRSKTFELVKDDTELMWFLLMCNMPFFKDRLNWGGSIRGAWWETQPPQKLFSCALYVGDEQITDWEFTPEEWEAFVRAMIAFAAEPAA